MGGLRLAVIKPQRGFWGRCRCLLRQTGNEQHLHELVVDHPLWHAHACCDRLSAQAFLKIPAAKPVGGQQELARKDIHHALAVIHGAVPLDPLDT